MGLIEMAEMAFIDPLRSDRETKAEMKRFIVIPVMTTYDNDGKAIEYTATLTAPSGNSAAGVGKTVFEALRNLVNAKGPIASKAVDDYLIAKHADTF